ncbi:hypothetical protein BGX23_005384 [Mortierella sp. AD031]|nr:hypothetical protein BGX23_005384 [Mortierella sp. AD031]KAG0208622.1 hypothetical protein BGX33_006145 [Mortierella sp. NVP41]
MPAATFNRERTVGSQFPGSARSQGFQDQESQAGAQVTTTGSAPFPMIDGTAQANFDNFMMTMALEQDVDLSGFSRASQGNNGSNCTIPPTTAAAGGPAATSPATINQTQLLSGSRS